MPVSSNLPFHVPFVAGKELEYLGEVLEARSFGGNGTFTKRVQTWMSQRYEVPHVLLTHSCTAAMEMVGLMLGLGPGDEVIVPSYTFCTTASAFLRTGARIVFCEVNPATMSMDVADVASRITPKTRLIVPVHYGGLAADVDSVLALAEPRGIAVMEDTAQGVHARHEGRWLGTRAPFAAVSFHETKNIHCGLGGALFLQREEDFSRAEIIWERGTNRSHMLKGLVDKYTWVETGSSFYPSELQAAVLLAQLEGIGPMLAAKKAIYESYLEHLRPLVEAGIASFPEALSDVESNHHFFWLRFHDTDQANAARLHLKEMGIAAYFHYIPLHSSPMGISMGYQADDLPVTETWAPRVLRLPTHTEMTLEDAEHVASTLVRWALG